MIRSITTGLLLFLLCSLSFNYIESTIESVDSINENEVDISSASDPNVGEPLPDAVKKTDPQLDDALGKLVVKVVIDGKINTDTQKPYTETTIDTKFYSWKACVRLPILNVTCVEPYISVNDLTLGIRLTSDGTTLLSKSSPGTSECVNDAKLLGLVTLTPPLLPFKPLLDRIIRLVGYLPAQVLSVCLKLQNFQLTKDSFSGCVVFEANFVCWRGKCVSKTTKSLGCFNLPFNRNGGKLVVKPGSLRRKRSLEEISRLLDSGDYSLSTDINTDTKIDTKRAVRSSKVQRKKRVLRKRSTA